MSTRAKFFALPLLLLQTDSQYFHGAWHRDFFMNQIAKNGTYLINFYVNLQKAWFIMKGNDVVS